MTSGDLVHGAPAGLAECQKVAHKVALPPIAPGLDKVAVIARYQAALITANNRIDGVAECLAQIDALQIGTR